MYIYNVKDLTDNFRSTTVKKEGLFFTKLKSAMDFRDKIINSQVTKHPNLVLIDTVYVEEA
jgi:hypothetical protein